jgi:hypothetical protein
MLVGDLSQDVHPADETALKEHLDAGAICMLLGKNPVSRPQLDIFHFLGVAVSTAILVYVASSIVMTFRRPNVKVS